MEDNVESTFKVKRGNLFRDKPWVVSTFVLGILVILLLAGNAFHLTGGVISSQKAGENAINFLNSYVVPNGGLTVDSVNENSKLGIYVVNVSSNGKVVPVYLSKDGNYIDFGSGIININAYVKSLSSAIAASNSNTQAQEIPKSDKPVVELFVMSYCPYGTQAEKGILPVVNLLGDKIDFKVRFVDYSMHGQKEVDENVVQYCIQKEQPSKFISYLTYFLQTGDEKSSLTSAGINQAQLSSCILSTNTQFNVTKDADAMAALAAQGKGSYPPFNIDKTLNQQYGVQGSPTLVINGVQVTSARDPASFLDVICQAFSDGSVPTECGTQLSTTTPSSGFGSGTGTSSGTQCA